jgi:hypothetical protein
MFHEHLSVPFAMPPQVPFSATPCAKTITDLLLQSSERGHLHAGPSPQLTKRNEPARRFVPEHEAYACKDLA